MKTTFIPITSAISDFIDDFDIDWEVQEDLIIKWATDVLRQINTDEQLTHKIGLIDVKNYKAKLPNDLKLVCEASFRLEEPECTGAARREIVSQWVQDTDEGCQLEINVNCPKCHKTSCSGCGQDFVEVNVDRIWELQNPFYHYSGKFGRVSRFGYGTSVYNPNFQLLKYDANSAWRNINMHIKDCSNLYCQQCEHTYSLSPPNIEVSFKEGEVLLSYLARVTDENGDLMIPDEPNAIEAVGDYILYRWLRKEWARTRAPKDRIAYREAKIDSEVSIGRARSALQMPDYQTWAQWFRNNRYYKMEDAYKNLVENGKPRLHQYGRTKRDQLRDTNY